MEDFILRNYDSNSEAFKLLQTEKGDEMVRERIELLRSF